MLDASEITPQMLQSLPPQARALFERMQQQHEEKDREIERKRIEIQRKDVRSSCTRR